MANTKQAKKRAKQAVKHREHNMSLRSMLRTHIKKVVNAVAAGNLEEAKTAYDKAVPVLDRSATKGLIHKNKAARHKSRLAKHIKILGDTSDSRRNA